MLIKQDFTNLLSKEITQLQSIIEVIEKEIEIRNHLDKNILKIFPNDFEAQYKNELEIIHNKRAILDLQNELKSKNEFLSKLKEKMLHDAPEIEADFLEAINNYDLVKDKINDVEDAHDKVRCKYALSELDLWLEKKLDPAYKEACGFWFKALKMSIIESGVKV